MARGAVHLAAIVLAAWLAQAPQNVYAAPVAKPALTLPDLEGEVHQLAEWRGTLVLVNFWATWCAPCQAEIRNLIRYQARYRSKGLQVVGVGLDDPIKLRNFRDSFAMNYPVLVAHPDRSLDMLRAWGNDRGVIPFTVLLDGAGSVLETVTGVVDDEVMESMVLPYLESAAAEFSTPSGPLAVWAIEP